MVPRLRQGCYVSPSTQQSRRKDWGLLAAIRVSPRWPSLIQHYKTDSGNTHTLTDMGRGAHMCYFPQSHLGEGHPQTTWISVTEDRLALF